MIGFGDSQEQGLWERKMLQGQFMPTGDIDSDVVLELGAGRKLSLLANDIFSFH